MESAIVQYCDFKFVWRLLAEFIQKELKIIAITMG